MCGVSEVVGTGACCHTVLMLSTAQQVYHNNKAACSSWLEYRTAGGFTLLA